MSHFYVSFKITLGADYRLRLQMLCRQKEEEPDNSPISKMSLYFFPPLLLYVNPSSLSNRGVLWWWIQWWVLGSLIKSHGE